MAACCAEPSSYWDALGDGCPSIQSDTPRASHPHLQQALCSHAVCTSLSKLHAAPRGTFLKSTMECPPQRGTPTKVLCVLFPSLPVGSQRAKCQSLGDGNNSLLGLTWWQPFLPSTRTRYNLHIKTPQQKEILTAQVTTGKCWLRASYLVKFPKPVLLQVFWL